MAFDQKQYQKEYQLRNREQIKAQRKGYYEANKHWLVPASREKRVLHAKRYNENRLNRLYALRPGQYEEMLASQGNACAICKSADPGQYNSTRFNIDHCHETGAVRGLLCHTCNRGLGLLQDSPEFLESAARYVRNHRK
jgi:hypothetical protein